MSGPPEFPDSPDTPHIARQGQSVDRRTFFRQILHRGIDELEHIARQAGRKIGDWVSEARTGGAQEAGEQPITTERAQGSQKRSHNGT